MDRELADLIAQYANEARVSVSAEIPGYLSIQNVSRLFHFTSIHNLESIVTNGFLFAFFCASLIALAIYGQTGDSGLTWLKV